MNGKGSKPRPYLVDLFNRNYEAIFRRNKNRESRTRSAAVTHVINIDFGHEQKKQA